MMKRIILIVYIISLMVILINDNVFPSSDTGTIVFGADSTQQGYITQLNNSGMASYIKIKSVAPIVNRLRILNLRNNNIVFDGYPKAGNTIYAPCGTYMVTGWSSYGTCDKNAVTVEFTDIPQAASENEADVKEKNNKQITVNGNPLQPTQNTTTIITTGPAYNSYQYPYYNIYPPACIPATPQLIWCTYCGKYHGQSGCVWTIKQKSVLDPYNPYWRGR